MEEKETFTMLDENNIEREVQIITITEVKGQNYIVYAIEKNDTEDNIFVSRLVKDEQGNEKIEDIIDDQERSEVFAIVQDLINETE